MAFTVTARHSGNSGTSSAQTLASSSTTPTASSLLLVGMAAVNDNHTTNQGWQSPVGGSLTYTSVGESTDAPFAVTLTNFALSAAMYRADVGGSPSAHTVTVDAFSGTNLAFYDVRACDVTGHGSSTPVQAAANGGTIGSGGSGSDSGSGTVTLGATPTAGNLIVVYFGCAADVAAAPASPTAGGGKTFTAVSTSTGPNSNGGMWYRVADGAESATITCADLGQSIGAYGAVAVEVAAPAADSALVPLQQWPTVSLVGGPWPRIQTGIPDSAVTGDAAVTLSDTAAGADALTANAAVPLSDTSIGTDALTVSATAALADIGTGADGLTVAAQVPLADTGSATDNLTTTAAAPLSDIATGADSLSVAVAVTLTDTGVGTDTRTSTAAVPLGETATGNEALTATAAVPLADVGAGVYVLTVGGSGVASLPDAATGSDQLAVAAALSLADPRTATDALAIASGVPLSQTAIGTDALVVTVTVTLTDTAAATDFVFFGVPPLAPNPHLAIQPNLASLAVSPNTADLQIPPNAAGLAVSPNTGDLAIQPNTADLAT